MLEPLTATVFSTLLSGRPFTAHCSPSKTALRMVKRTTASSFPPDFFTPRPRRVKGKERAHPDDDCAPQRMSWPGDAGPSTPFPGCRRPSVPRDGASCRPRARRISGPKLVHTSSHREFPLLRNWDKQANEAQRRHASSLPDVLATSSYSPSEWQQDQWRTCVLEFCSKGASSDLEEVWNAFELLQKSGGCESMKASHLLEFASRIAAFADIQSPETPTSHSPRLWGIRLHFALESLSSRIPDAPLDPDRLLWQCLKLRASASTGDFSDAISGAREVSAVPMEPAQQPHVVEVYISIMLALRRDRNAVKVLEFLIEEWDAVGAYLEELPPQQHPSPSHAVKSFRHLAFTIVTSMDNPAAFMLTVQNRWSQESRQVAANFLIRVLCRAGFAEDALGVAQMMQRQSLPVHFELQLDVVRALVRADSFVSANSLFASLQRWSASPRAFHLYQSAGLYLFAHQSDVARAEEYFDRLVQRDWVTIADITMIMHVHARRGDTARVVDLFHHFFPDPSTNGSLLQTPNIYHYTTVIFAHAQRGDLDGMNMWLGAMTKAGIVPDIYVYSIILHCFARRGEIESMSILLDQMRTAGKPPTAVCYTTVFTALAQRQDAAGAEVLYKRALSEGIVPDRRMVTALMNVYVESGQWQGVIRVFDYMASSRNRGLQLSIEVYNTLLKAYVLIGAPFRVVANLFQKLDEVKVRPDQYTFALLIQSACDSGLMEIASDVFAEMEKLTEDWQSSFHINTYVLTIIMSGYLRKNQRAKARAIFEGMKARGIEPSAVTYGAIVRAYSVEKRSEGIQVAEAFINSLMTTKPEQRTWMKPVGGRGLPLEFIYAPLMVAHTWAGGSEKVEQLFQDMLDNGGEPTLGTMTSLLDVYRRTGNVEGVRRIWPQIYDLGLRHSQINSLLQEDQDPATAGLRSHGVALCIPLSIYVDAMSAAGHHSEIAETWTTLRSEGMAFDSHNWNHLSVALVRAGELERAFEVIEGVILPYRRKIQTISVQRDRHPDSPLMPPPEEGELPPSPSESPMHYRGRRSPKVALNTKKFKPGMEVGKRDDFAHILHVLYQVSPIWNVWRPHGATLRVLQAVLEHLEAGRLVQPIGPGGQEHSEPVVDVKGLTERASRAGEILGRIYDSCPETVQLIREFAMIRQAQRQKIIYRRSS